MTSAIIFVCSTRVEPYVNVVCHLHDKFRIREFKFVTLTGVSTEGPPTSYSREILNMLEGLSNSVYIDRYCTFSEQEKESYREVKTVLSRCQNSAHSVTLDELSKFLSEQERNSNDEIIIDVTGLPKMLMGQVLLVCLSGEYSVYTFELQNRDSTQSPENSLYFSLPVGAFNYPLVSRDPAVQASIQSLVPLKKVAWGILIVITAGFACLAIGSIYQPDNFLFTGISLFANVLGITGGVHQVISMRKGHT